MGEVPVSQDSAITESNRIDWLDGLRAVAVFMVILVHSGQASHSLKELEPSAYLARAGQYGVQLFFVISTITVIITISRTKNIFNWIARRYFRIAPMYYFAIVLQIFENFARAKLLNNEFYFDTNSILANLIFIHGWYPPGNNNVVPGGWSIAVEMTFYVVAAGVAYLALFARYSKSLLLIGGVVAGLLCLLVTAFFAAGDVENNGYLYFMPSTQFPIFIMGSLLYLHYSDLLYENRTRYYLIVIGFILWIAGAYVGVWGNFANLLAPEIVALAYWLILMGLGRFKAFLSSPGLVHIGRISYSIYLLHFFVLDAVRIGLKVHIVQSALDVFPYGLGIYVVAAITLLLTVFIANRAYLYIEKPFIHLGHGLFSKSSPSVA